MALGVVASIAGGLLGAFGSNKAAKAQQAAAAAQTALEERIYNETTERFDPFYNSGQNALAAYNYELGLGPRPTFGGNPMAVNEITETIEGTGNPAFAYGNQGGMVRDPNFPDRFIYPGSQDTTRTRYQVGDQMFDDRSAADQFAAANPVGGSAYGGFEASPWQNYVMQEGQDAVQASASNAGGLYSGATMQALSDRAQTTAGSFYENYLNRLGGLVGSGQSAAGNQAAAGSNFAQGAGNALAASGNAQSAGIVGGVNAINTGIENALAAWNYQNNQTRQPSYTSNGISVPQDLFRRVQGVL
jgi:hypothetical protein